MRQSDVTWELYHLAADPAEESNVIDSHAERAARMREDLESWLVSVVQSLNGKDYTKQ